MTFMGSRHFTFVAPSSIKKKYIYIYIYLFIYHASVKVNINNLDSLLHVFIKIFFFFFFFWFEEQWKPFSLVLRNGRKGLADLNTLPPSSGSGRKVSKGNKRQASDETKSWSSVSGCLLRSYYVCCAKQFAGTSLWGPSVFLWHGPHVHWYPSGSWG